LGRGEKILAFGGKCAKREEKKKEIMKEKGTKMKIRGKVSVKVKCVQTGNKLKQNW
jgi:hypothetical protein